MANNHVRIGWYLLEDSFDADSIDIAIRDRRTNELITFKIDSLEQHDRIVQFLSDNPQVGTLKRLKEGSL